MFAQCGILIFLKNWKTKFKTLQNGCIRFWLQLNKVAHISQKKKTQNNKLVAYWLFERHEQLAAVAGVVGGGAPCRVTTSLESAKKNAVLK